MTGIPEREYTDSGAGAVPVTGKTSMQILRVRLRLIGSALHAV